ncbi:hypothetical protein LJR011_000195 [Agrobacterium tumefaciens]
MISIGQLMDADDIVAEIRMERQASSSAFILMEGATDIRRFESFLDEETVSSVNCWGKSKLLSASKKLNEVGFQGFVSLADADFDRILGGPEVIANVCYSENHDFDMDAFRTDVFSRYLAEVADKSLCGAFSQSADIREKVAVGLKALSAAKLANCRGTIKAKFSELNWIPSFDGFDLNREQLAFIILKKDNPDRDMISRILELITAEEHHDVWQLTNGHDFACALGVSLRTKISNRKHPQTTGEEVEKHIRLALSESDFRSMEVYRFLCGWQTSNRYRTLKKHLLH